MSEYQVVAESMSAADAKSQLLAWIEQNKTAYDKMLARDPVDTAEGLIMEIVRADGGTKYRYLIRKSLLMSPTE